ncbi:MAG: hypothetical protein L0H63_07350 [Nitrococcus sp.]|nr:hypothetical protein [Nitrococcus sp.]
MREITVDSIREWKTTMEGRPRLLDQVHNRTRFEQCSIRTGKAYVDWIRRFILF